MEAYEEAGKSNCEQAREGKIEDEDENDDDYEGDITALTFWGLNEPIYT